MELPLNIPSTNVAARKKMASFAVLIALSIIIATFLRVSLLLIYPLVTAFILVFYRFRITASFLLLLGITALSFLLSLFDNLFLKYKLLSLFYMLPFLFLLFCHPAYEKGGVDQLSILMTALSFIALINNLVGIVQIIMHPSSDDSFVGLYSQYSISINGLMLLNSILFFYYFIQFITHRRAAHLVPAIFFVSSAILGFYGAGLVIVFAAFILAFFRLKIVALLKTLSIGLGAFAVIVFTMYLVKPLVLEYNVANIKKLLDFNPETGARKITSFYNYGISYPKNAKDFLFGSGPGTFNSRSAFMVGSPSYFQGVSFIKDEEKPYYFENYAYTLWNENNTRQDLYLDGFRNQPFSSVLAFLGEYGLIFTLIFIFLYFSYYQHVARTFYRSKNKLDMSVHFRVFKFLMILLPLLLLIDNYLEYPEIMLLVILGIKFAHAGIEQKNLNTA